VETLMCTGYGWTRRLAVPWVPALMHALRRGRIDPWTRHRMLYCSAVQSECGRFRSQGLFRPELGSTHGIRTWWPFYSVSRMEHDPSTRFVIGLQSLPVPVVCTQVGSMEAGSHMESWIWSWGATYPNVGCLAGCLGQVTWSWQ
jgi:hypothetical protein